VHYCFRAMRMKPSEALAHSITKQQLFDNVIDSVAAHNQTYAFTKQYDTSNVSCNFMEHAWYSGTNIAVRDRMFLGMQDFDFAQIQGRNQDFAKGGLENEKCLWRHFDDVTYVT